MGEDGEAADRPRLPPGQRATRRWPVLDLGAQPQVGPERFRLDIDGAVRRPLGLRLAEFMALEQTERVSDIHCVTGWSRLDNRWQGVAAATVLALVEPRERARHVLLHGSDGYATNITLAQFAAPGVMLAHGWEGAPLTIAHGGPVRMVVPQLYFWKSAKWLRRIEFLATDRPGFWERNGYHNNGDPWGEERCR